MSFISWRNEGSLPTRVCITLLLFLGPHISMIFPFLATSLDFTWLCYELHPRPSSRYVSSLFTLSFYTRHLTLDVPLPPFPPLHGISTAISQLYALHLYNTPSCSSRTVETLKRGRESSSRVSITIYQLTWHIPKNFIHHHYCCQNLRPCK